MLSNWLFELTGWQMFADRLFRGGGAAVLAALMVIALMPRWIRWLRKHDATSDFTGKNETAPPIMGGIMLVFAVFLSGLAFAQVNGYSISILFILVSYALVGAVDDLMKVRYKKLVLSGKLTKADYQDKADGLSSRLRLSLYFIFSISVAMFAYKFVPGIDGHITVPFVKPEVWYPYLPAWAFIVLMSFVTTATANGANFTDGIDTLVSIPIITTAIFAGVVAYVSGNAVFANYLLLPHIPGVDEIMPIAAAMVGALTAYLWYNSPPAEIYMGDAGSIGFGGALGMMFVFVKAELFLPIVGVIFVLEAFSSFAQIGWFKYTRKTRSDKTGQRLFLRAPLHEHYKIKWKTKFSNSHELQSKLMWRFHLISIFALVIGSLIFFKIR
jgi:phospho-N-acetylmuramoyl-pentapeptide-transferase